MNACLGDGMLLTRGISSRCWSNTSPFRSCLSDLDAKQRCTQFSPLHSRDHCHNIFYGIFESGRRCVWRRPLNMDRQSTVIENDTLAKGHLMNFRTPTLHLQMTAASITADRDGTRTTQNKTIHRPHRPKRKWAGLISPSTSPTPPAVWSGLSQNQQGRPDIEARRWRCKPRTAPPHHEAS
jgi:hypothetical protein